MCVRACMAECIMQSKHTFSCSAASKTVKDLTRVVLLFWVFHFHPFSYQYLWSEVQSEMGLILILRRHWRDFCRFETDILWCHRSFVAFSFNVVAGWDLPKLFGLDVGSCVRYTQVYICVSFEFICQTRAHIIQVKTQMPIFKKLISFSWFYEYLMPFLKWSLLSWCPDYHKTIELSVEPQIRVCIYRTGMLFFFLFIFVKAPLSGHCWFVHSSLTDVQMWPDQTRSLGLISTPSARRWAGLHLVLYLVLLFPNGRLFQQHCVYVFPMLTSHSCFSSGWNVGCAREQVYRPG